MDALDKVLNYFTELFNFDLGAMASSLIPEDSFLRELVPESLFESKEKAIEKVPGGRTGMGIAAEGLGYLHKGEEVLEAAEISRIERALAGQTLNAQMMERQGAGGEAAGMGSAPIIMDNSTVVQNNHQSTFTNPIGQMLPNEASNFVSKMAA